MWNGFINYRNETEEYIGEMKLGMRHGAGAHFINDGNRHYI